MHLRALKAGEIVDKQMARRLNTPERRFFFLRLSMQKLGALREEIKGWTQIVDETVDSFGENEIAIERLETERVRLLQTRQLYHRNHGLADADALRRAKDESNNWFNEQTAKLPRVLPQQVSAMRILIAIASGLPHEDASIIGRLEDLSAAKSDKQRMEMVKHRLTLLESIISRRLAEEFAKWREDDLKGWAAYNIAMNQSPHTTAKGFFHSKAAERIGDVMVWGSLAGFAAGATFYFTGGSDLVGTVCIISATVVGWLSGKISAKGRREEKLLN